MNVLAKYEPDRRRELRILAEDRLRWMILRHDALAAEIARVDDCIARESREYADASGLTVRPTLEQLRRQLLQGGKQDKD